MMEVNSNFKSLYTTIFSVNYFFQGIAQSLYEGIDMGNLGTEGLITYMRTDSEK